MARFIMTILIFGILMTDGVRPTILHTFNHARPAVALVVNAQEKVVEIGDLVIRTVSKETREEAPGIVIDTTYRWPDVRDEELLVTVLYPHSGEEIEWGEDCLEVIS